MFTTQHQFLVDSRLVSSLPAWYAPVSRHNNRVRDLVDRIAAIYGLSGELRRLMGCAAIWHDIGKLALGPYLINKPGPLSGPEWAQMRRHPSVGAAHAYKIGVSLAVVQMIDAHHERWDGRGYGLGLARRQIPLGAQIIALADVFDAMIVDRPYRRAMPFGDVLDHMTSERERAFHPELLEVALSVFGAFTPEICITA